MTQMNIPMKQKQTHRQREQACVCPGVGDERGVELEIGVSRCGFLYVDWIRSKALLYGTENHIQYAMIKHNGKLLKNNVYIHE